MATLNYAALKVFLEFNPDGSVDHKKTLNNVTAQITEYELRQKDQDGLAARAINAVFDQYKGATIATDALLSAAHGVLKSNPDNYAVLDKAMRRYLKANTGARLSVFGMGVGKGLWRWADQAPEKTS